LLSCSLSLSLRYSFILTYCAICSGVISNGNGFGSSVGCNAFALGFALGLTYGCRTNPGGGGGSTTTGSGSGGFHFLRCSVLLYNIVYVYILNHAVSIPFHKQDNSLLVLVNYLSFSVSLAHPGVVVLPFFKYLVEMSVSDFGVSSMSSVGSTLICVAFISCAIASQILIYHN
jgi:hypothetical protein